jgi:hypothetical protein
MSFGPSAIEDVAEGLLVKAWYARADADGIMVYLCPSEGAEWGDEELILDLSEGAPAEALSLTFDADGRPVLVVEAGGNLLVRFWTGGSYTYTALGAGISPQIVHQAPDSELWAEIVLLYEGTSAICYRLGSEDYATEHETTSVLAANQHIERVILDADNRLHLILSTRDAVAGTYTLTRITSTSGAPCLEASGATDRVDDGIQTVFVFTNDGEIVATCELDCDLLLIGGGGDSGDDIGADTTLWATEDGIALVPDEDEAPAAHIAKGGGSGGYIDQDGQDGASGGGGGGQSPSNNAMWTSGGRGLAGQGYPGGGGRSSWGLLPTKIAASGGGGGYGGPGTGGSYEQAGGMGPGGTIPGWSYPGPRGGGGRNKVVHDPISDTGPQSGGGGAGGVIVLDGFLIQPGQRVPFTVAKVYTSGGTRLLVHDPPGRGGHGGEKGFGGMVAIRINVDGAAAAAVLSGGVESTPGDGYKYHVFTSTGQIIVVTPGSAEVLVVGGGGGGGSGCGGGGGGGDVRFATVNLLSPLADVEVGAGGAGGSAGGAGANGAGSSIEVNGSPIVAARGGGGGAGASGAAGASATGGGGHGAAGAGGVGKWFRGYPGGDGGGYAKTGGGTAKCAGGGGGAGDDGHEGATEETQGNELADDWNVPTGVVVNLAGKYGDFTANPDRGLLHKDVSRGPMFVQGAASTNHADAFVGFAARASHPSGVDAAPDGHWAWIQRKYNRFGIDAGYMTALGMNYATWYTMQLYVADSLQQAHIETTGYQYRYAATATTYNGQNARSFGGRCYGGANGTGRRIVDSMMCFRSKYLVVGGLPAGAIAKVINTAGSVVAQATEAGGTASIDCSRYGNGTAGATEAVPVIGWNTLRVVTAGGATVAELTTDGIYPGAELDVVGDALVFREDGSGELLVGLLVIENFTGTTPGPERGTGGEGRAVPAAWAAIVGGDGYLAGGGGGGAELVQAGLGGVGGGGAGAVGAAAPVAGTANTGGGGGASGASATAGAAGGSGLVILRTAL